MILLLSKSEYLSLAMVCSDSHDATAATFEEDGCVDERGVVTSQRIDEDVEGVIAQILRVTGLVDVPDVDHMAKSVI